MSEKKILEEFEYYWNNKWLSDAGRSIGKHDAFQAWQATCAHKDAEFAKEREQFAESEKARRQYFAEMCEVIEKNEQLRALIAMQAEALKEAEKCINTVWVSHHANRCDSALAEIKTALSSSAESVAAWEAEKLEPLRREIAMLRSSLSVIIRPYNSSDYKVTGADVAKANALLSDDDTQATAEAYERELKAKALKEISRHPQFIGGSYARVLENMADELRAQSAQKKGGE